MSARAQRTKLSRSEDYGALQRVVDLLYKDRREVSRLDCILLAETFDLCSDLKEIVELLPPGMYPRQRLCDQLNSAIAGHGWGFVYGTVE